MLGPVVQGGQDDGDRGPAHAGRAGHRVDVPGHVGAGQFAHHDPALAGGQRQLRHGRHPDAPGHQGQDGAQALELPRHRRDPARRGQQPVHRLPGRLARRGGHPPAALAQLAQVHWLGRVGQWVPAGHHQHQRVAQQRVELEHPGAGAGQPAGPVVDQGDFDLAPAHRAEPLVPPGLPEQQGQRRVRAQAAGQGGREGRRGGGERGDRHPAGRLPFPGGQIGLGFLDLGQDAFGVDGEPAARVGELGRPGGAVQQNDAGFPFQRGQLLGNRGRGVAQRGRGGRDRAPACELLEQPEPVQIQHKFSLPSRIVIAACANAYQTASWSGGLGVAQRPTPLRAQFTAQCGAWHPDRGVETHDHG